MRNTNSCVDRCLGLLETYVEVDVYRRELELIKMEKAGASYEEIQRVCKEKEQYQTTLNSIRSIREQFKKEQDLI